MPDIRDDAEAAGVKIGGRSLHSARALLNGRPAREPAPAHSRRRNSAENQIRRLVADFERTAAREAEHLRAAIEEALRMLRRAIGDKRL